jgi:catechol 2,3-dioxygenase-like lactoylglutathione lyase family enzyme
VLDHIYISVSDVPRSLAFYAATLEPLGWRELGSYDSSTGPAEVPDLYGLADGAYGSGVAVGSSIWLRRRQSGETGLYVGLLPTMRPRSTPPTLQRFRRAERARASQQYERTSARVTTQPISLTSTATTLK